MALRQPSPKPYSLAMPAAAIHTRSPHADSAVCRRSRYAPPAPPRVRGAARRRGLSQARDGSSKEGELVFQRARRACPDAPTTRIRPRGFIVARAGRRTERIGAAVSLADMMGVTPSGTGHWTSNSGSSG